MTLLDAPAIRLGPRPPPPADSIHFPGRSRVADHCLVAGGRLAHRLAMDMEQPLARLRCHRSLPQGRGEERLADAYGLWIHDKDWQKHPVQGSGYTFERFQQDWSPTSSGNDYGAIKSHKIKAARGG